MIGKALITFILQAILVIAAIFVFSIFDPFNIFNSKKLTMKDTPSIVNSIQGIGQLITAEYYGEVIKGSGEALEIMIDSSKASDRKRLRNIYDEVDDALTELKFSEEENKKINKRQVYKRFNKGYPDIVNNPDYGTLLTLIEKTYGLSEKKFLYYIFDNDDADLDNYPVDKKTIKLETVINAYVEDKHSTTKREQRRIANNSLVLLGRGWVKVGFDFSNFEEKHFNYLPDRNLIRLKGHKPKIISATINPWFIPERKMKGFEYLYVGKKLNKDADDPDGVKAIQDLKGRCLENLINDAMDAGILETAQQQAEITLAQFFTLLLGKDITVRIYADPKDVIMEDVLADSVISGREMQSIDSVVGRYSQEDPKGTFEFLKRLYDNKDKQFLYPLPWENANENLEAAALYYKVADDGFLTSTEHEMLLNTGNEQSLTLKNYLYFSKAQDSLFKKLDMAKFDLTKLSQKFKDEALASKKRSDSALQGKALALRKNLTSFELKRCDSILNKFVQDDKMEQAYQFAMNTRNYLGADEPWKNASHNWKILSVYRENNDPGHSEKKIKTPETQIPGVPRKTEYFYYLFYTDSLKNNFDQAKKLLANIDQNGSVKPNTNLERRLSALRANVTITHKQNRDSLVHHLKTGH